MLYYGSKARRLFERLSADRGGTSSMEYVIVAASIIAGVSVTFSASATSIVASALSNCVDALKLAVAAAMARG